MNPTPQIGRPKHIYRTSPNDFTSYWNHVKKHPSPFDVLEPGFGAVGYVRNEKTKQHLFRISLVPTSSKSKFYWVRLDTPDDEIYFAMPAPMAADDVPKLLEMWEAETGVQWVEGAVGSPFLPHDWKCPSPYVHTKTRFHVLVYDETSQHYSLITRAGIAAIRRPGEQLAGIICPDTGIWPIIEHIRLNARDVPLPTKGPRLHIDLVHALWGMSANYFREWLITPRNGSPYPHIPHSPILNIPSMNIPRFEP